MTTQVDGWTFIVAAAGWKTDAAPGTLLPICYQVELEAPEIPRLRANFRDGRYCARTRPGGSGRVMSPVLAGLRCAQMT
jgi:hypothetical protein